VDEGKEKPEKRRKIAERRFDLNYVTFPTTRPEKRLRVTVRPRDPLYYIYTSGTTGVSKAAKFSHLRFIGCALTWTGPTGLTGADRYYVPLPLFHGNGGCVAVAPCYFVGATIVLRQKFSASAFWDDVKKSGCTAAIYIGEFWRFLQLISFKMEDNSHLGHTLRVVVGNGLRPEVWDAVTQTFAIPLVVEHYGSTEMPGDAILNCYNKFGSCGYVPPSVWKTKEAKIIRFDVEVDTIVRNERGLCIECPPNEPGEIIFKLPEGKYDGYVGEEATRGKLYQDVFEKGDTWWSSGDLLKVDEEGFFYFVDRIGDTYRFKGENVATTEVSQVLHGFHSICEANGWCL